MESLVALHCAYCAPPFEVPRRRRSTIMMDANPALTGWATFLADGPPGLDGSVPGAAFLSSKLFPLQVEFAVRLIFGVTPEAAQIVVVYHPGGLHPGVDDDWTYEFEASLF